uniref:Uncharacterized protein n=1 Tax=Candidatus Kentrum sp. LPFa TaxID=2126335 RepID=A0A450WD41_9GAMM|nr:MAG: hypothetical protein BECKLPF1236B_GA0070989_10692 [Candidatus Kentron sp. LPFa]
MIKKSENLKNVVFHRPFWFWIFRVGVRATQLLLDRGVMAHSQPGQAGTKKDSVICNYFVVWKIFDKTIKKYQGNICHWIPAFAGMTGE